MERVDRVDVVDNVDIMDIMASRQEHAGLLLVKSLSKIMLYGNLVLLRMMLTSP